MEWFRWYHGAISDPKWPLVARKSGKSIGVVVSIWASLLEHASQEQNRGSIEGFNPEAIDALFGYEDETTVTVCNAMRNAGIINAENFISSWEKRQPKRERDDDSSGRVRRFREKQKANNSDEVESGSGNETDSNATVTPCNAQNRTEQNREDIKKTLPPKGDGAKKTPAYPELFEAAWRVYPKKTNKGAALKAWKQATKRGMSVDLLPQHIESRMFEPDWRKEDGRFVPHLSTWLNADGWLDEGASITPPADDDDAWLVTDFYENDAGIVVLPPEAKRGAI